MVNHPELIHPKPCFCQIPDAELRPWVVKRYQEHCPTSELSASTDDPHEQECISIVALLDVDDATMLEMMGNVELPQHHIVHCRMNVKKILSVA